MKIPASQHSLRFLADHVHRVTLFLQPKCVLRERIDAEAQCDKPRFVQLSVEWAVTGLLDAQLTGQPNPDVAADNLVADVDHLFRHAVEIAFVEHEQRTAVIDQPFELIDEILRGSDAPVEAFGAERAARPAAAAAGDHRNQLIAVEIPVDAQIEPFVAGEIELIEIVLHRCRHEQPIRGVKPRHDARQIFRPLAGRQPFDQGPDRQIGFPDTHVIGLRERPQSDIGIVTAEASDQEQQVRQRIFHLLDQKMGERRVALLDGEAKNLWLCLDDRGGGLIYDRAQISQKFRILPEIIVLRLPGIGRHFATAGHDDLAALIEQPANMVAMVGDDIEIERFEIDAGLLYRVVHIAKSVRHQRKIARRTVNQEEVGLSGEPDSWHLDRINVLGERRPSARRDRLEGDARQDFGVGYLDSVRQRIRRHHTLDRAGRAHENRLHAFG